MTRRESLGLRRGVVEVAPYDPQWPVLFEVAADELRAGLGPSIIAVHHVGSTAVPGLCAKPILDVLVSVPDFGEALGLVPGLEALGYVFRRDEEIEDRHYFRRGDASARTHHLSLTTPRSRHHVDTIAFRDALRRDPRLASRYADLKLELARRFPRDRESYVNGKSELVLDVLRSIEHSWLPAG